MEKTMALCSNCGADTDVTAQAKRLRDSLTTNQAGSFSWTCTCGGLNQGTVIAPLDR